MSHNPSNLNKLSKEARENIIAKMKEIFESPAAIPTPVAMPEVSSIDDQALDNADNLISTLIDSNAGDYTKYRQEIAELWCGELGLWNGNDEATTSLDDPNLGDLRLIQEDYYDQHMDEDGEKPSCGPMLAYVDGYIFLA